MIKIQGEKDAVYELHLVDNDGDKGLTANASKQPEWSLLVDLGNANKVRQGGSVHINAHLSFIGEGNTRLLGNNISKGEWLYPVRVEDKKTGEKYTLAYINVIVSEREETHIISGVDVPPLDGTMYNLTKGGMHGKERVHAGTDHQQAS